MTSAGHWLSCQSKAQMSMEEARKVDIKYPLCVGHTNISFIVCLWANRSHQGSSVPLTVCVCAKSLQLCPALCNTMDFPRLLCLWVFSRQEHWSELPFASPGDLPNPGMEPMSLMSPALAGGFLTTSATWEAHKSTIPRYKNKKQNHHQMYTHWNASCPMEPWWMLVREL